MAANDPSPTLGAKLGTRVAGLVGQAVAAQKVATARHSANLGAVIVEEFFDLVSSEIRGTLGGVVGDLADHPLMPDSLKPAFHFMARGTGQWQTFLTQSVVGGAMSTGLGALMSNLLGPVVQELIAKEPTSLLDAGSAAAAEARGFTDGYSNQGEAAKGGIDAARFRKLVRLNTRHPDIGTVLDALNRKVIGEDAARSLLRSDGYDLRDLDTILSTAPQQLSGQELAQLVNFGVLSEGEATPHAERTGMAASDFHMLVVGGGQPPALGTLLEAYRRGIIDQTRLAKGIQQGPTRVEWTDVLTALRFQPMSPEAAIQAAVQGHLTEGEARTKAAHAGLDPADFDPLYATAGEAPGPQTVLDWLNRGIFSQPEAVDAIKETRLKNKYIPALLESAVNLPPQDTVRMLFRSNELSRTEAYDYLRKLGYDDRITNALLNASTAAKDSNARELTMQQVLALYAERAIDQTIARDMLHALGYDDTDTEFLLDSGDLARLRKFSEAAISKVGSQFTSHHIDVNRASSALDALGLPTGQRDDLIALWSIQADVVTKSLTPSQIIAAAKKDVFDFGTAEALLMGQGYAQQDADVLLVTGGVFPPGTPTQ